MLTAHSQIWLLRASMLFLMLVGLDGERLFFFFKKKIFEGG